MISRGVAPTYVTEGGLRVVNQKCVRDHTIDYGLTKRHDGTKKKVSPDRLIRAGDVLVNSTGVGTLGRVAQARVDPDEPTTTDTHVTIIRPNVGMFYPAFFGYVMTTIERQLAASGEGASGQTELSRNKLKDGFLVSFPKSLAEQQRIVTILDEAFEAIATATSNAEKNLSNARELFSRHAEFLLEPKAGWRTASLNRLGTLRTGTTPRSGDEGSYGNHVPFIKPGDFRPDGELDYDNDGLSEAGLSRSRLIPEDSALMVCIGATIGKAGYTARRIATNQQINAFTPAGEIDARFAYHQMCRRGFQDAVRRNAGQATLPIISKSKWGELTMSFPRELQEQQSLVAKLDLLRAESDRLYEHYTRKLAALAELKQSLLARAFSGKLTSSVPAATVLAPANDNAFATPEHVANIIAFAYWRHERAGRQRTFGHVKAQKTLHMVESVGGVELGRQPWKDAAGPNDFAHMLKAEDWAREHRFFEFVRRPGGYDFAKLDNYRKMLSAAKVAVKPVQAAIDSATDLLLPLKKEDAEVLATVHAAWNNLILDGAEPTDDAILREARDDWHESKLKIAEAKFRDAIKLIRKKGIVPDGSAKRVVGQPKLL